MKLIQKTAKFYCDFCNTEIDGKAKTYTLGYSTIGGSAMYVQLYIHTPLGLSSDLCDSCMRKALTKLLEQVK